MDAITDFLHSLAQFGLILVGLFLSGLMFRFATNPFRKFGNQFTLFVTEQAKTNEHNKHILTGFQQTITELAKTTESLGSFIEEARERDRKQNQTLHEIIANNNLKQKQCEGHRIDTSENTRRIVTLEKTVGGIVKKIGYVPSTPIQHAETDN